MVLSGDPIQPTVFQAPYFRKPPLHNWLLALGALGGGAVTPAGARLLSSAAFVLLGLSVYALLRRRAPAFALLGFAVVMTNYLLLCEYGNAAESDLVLALFTFLAYAIYAANPLRPGNVAASALCMGLGVLTKGVSPLFFYPALVLLALLEPQARGRRLTLLGLHAGLALVLPGLWLLALHARGTAGQFLATGGQEVAEKALGTIGGYLRHLVAYPPRMFVVLLPWTALLAATWRRGRVTDPLYRSSLLVCLISLACFTLAAGARDRYLIPAIPCFAIVAAYRIDGERRVTPRLVWIVFVFLALVSAAGGVFLLAKQIRLQGVLLLFLAVIAAVLAPRRFRVREFGLAIALIAFTFFEHGLYHYRTTYRVPSYPAAQAIAGALTHPWPVLVEPRLDLIHIAADLEGITRRPVFDRDHFHPVPAYLLTNARYLDPRGRAILRLPYPRRMIGEVVLQEIDAETDAPATPTVPTNLEGRHGEGK
jgi:4-amino-4-deoxy-L-arabinose transferase-like glycosyltransferase